MWKPDLCMKNYTKDEKYLGKKLLAAFMNLKKAYGRVDRWSLRDLLIYCVGRCLLAGIRSFSKDVIALCEHTWRFAVSVGMRQEWMTLP